MPESKPEQASTRPVFSGDGVTGRITRRVFAYTLLTVLLMGGLGLYAIYTTIWNTIVETQPLALQLSREWVRERLDQAPAELERLSQESALQVWVRGVSNPPGGSTRSPSPPDQSALMGSFSEALARSSVFSGLLILDTQGDVLAAAGSGPGLAGLRALLRPKSSLGPELVDVMRTSQLRAELGGLQELSVRPIDPGPVPALELVSVPLRDPQGRAIATLHGLVRRSELAARLRAELLGAEANIFLVDGKRRVLASARPSGRAAGEPLLSKLLSDDGSTAPRVVWDTDLGEVMASSVPLGAHGWTLVATTPLVAAFQPLFLVVCAFLATGLVLIALFTTMASRFATRRIARPLWPLLQALRAAARDEFLPVSTARAAGEAEGLILAFNTMVSRHQFRSRELETSHRALQDQYSAFQHQYQTVSKRSITDPLTQLNNRRYFEAQLQRELKRWSRTGHDLAFLILDIDDFKKLNDTYGHAAGDEVLKQVARILKEFVRETDLLARFGGEEFVVVATQTTLEGAVTLAQKICTAIAETSFIVDDTMRPRSATVSVGVSVFKGSQTDLFNSADAALYRAKAAGKNCVMVAEDPDE